MQKTCPICGADIDISIAVEDVPLSSIRAEGIETVDLGKVQELAELQRLVDEKTDQPSESHKLEVDLPEANQGSRQLHREGGELDLEELLKQYFPYDEIIPVGNGANGAEVHQRIQTRNGNYYGTIIWESKNTRNCSDGWKSKIKVDHLNGKADLVLIAPYILLEDAPHYGFVDDLWITGFPYNLGLATALRQGLIQVELEQRSIGGEDQKIDMFIQYLSGLEFRQRVELVVNMF